MGRKLPIQSVQEFPCSQLVHQRHGELDDPSLNPALLFDGLVGGGNAVEADAGLLHLVVSRVADRRGVRSRLKEPRPLRLATNTNLMCVICFVRKGLQ